VKKVPELQFKAASAPAQALPPPPPKMRAHSSSWNKDEFALYACTLDDLAAVRPECHSWTDEQAPWLEITDILPRYARSSHNATPVSIGPRLATTGGKIPRPMI